MFTLGIFIGLYGYGIFLLGLSRALYPPVIWIYTILFLIASGIYWKKNGKKIHVNQGRKDIFSIFLLCILCAQACVNFIGALGPELGFDALWYHLTFPKIYLLKHEILHIPGGLLYYADMPKFVELLYTGVLAFSGILPKLIHFGFGILLLFTLFTLSRKFLPKSLALLVLIVLYANLVIGWESISAYIDLGRTFFELLSLSALLSWIEKKEQKWFVLSALFMGFAIASKVLAVESLVIMGVLIIGILIKRNMHMGKIIQSLAVYGGIALLIPLPWLVFSLINTGNPIYPFFTHTYPLSFPLQLFNPFYVFSSFWGLLLYAPDPLNPFYLMVLPLIIMYFPKWSRPLKIVALYALGGLFFWYITPRTGGGRFILPYLPMLSLISVTAVLSLPQMRVKKFLFVVIVLLAIVSIGYRGVANAKFLPVILGRESTNHFLAKHLNFSFGDFVDNDGYFATHIKPTDTVLLYGFHNLYYVDFPFIDSSWVQTGNVFTYIAVQNSSLPKRFQMWTLVYANPHTHVSLYTAGGIPWTY